MSRRPWLVVVVCVALLLPALPGAAWAHPRHPVISGSEGNAERVLSGADLTAAPVESPALPDHLPPPLVLAAGALALLAHLVVRRRPLALGLVLVVATAGLEGVVHAALHLHHVSHSDRLPIGASAAAPTALGPDAEIPTAPLPILLGPAPEAREALGASINRASNQGRAPPPFPA